MERAAVPPVGLASAGVPHTLHALQIQGGTQQGRSLALGPSRPWGGPRRAPLKLRNTGRGQPGSATQSALCPRTSVQKGN